MGCVNNKESQIANPGQFRKNQKISEGVYTPLISTIYNLLRKKNDIQIVRKPKNQKQIFFSQVVYNGTSMKPNDYKMLYNFKNILLVNVEQSAIAEIKQHSTPKIIYTISEEQAKEFLQLFPIFDQQMSKIQPKMIPLMAFYQPETVKGRNRRIVFLHSQKFINEQIYHKLQIDNIVTDSGNSTPESIVAKLRKPGSQRSLYLHSTLTPQQSISEILINYAKDQFNISEQNAKKYLQNVLPKIVANKPLLTITKSQSKIKTEQDVSLTQILQKNLKRLYEQMGSDQAAQAKLDRAYNLIVNLVSNIYNNKESQNFRKVRKTNKQINDLLGKYKYGIKLLQDIGFLDDGAFYVNNTDVKYLKVYRTDFDVAYKKFIGTLAKK